MGVREWRNVHAEICTCRGGFAAVSRLRIVPVNRIMRTVRPFPAPARPYIYLERNLPGPVRSSIHRINRRNDDALRQWLLGEPSCQDGTAAGLLRRWISRGWGRF